MTPSRARALSTIGWIAGVCAGGLGLLWLYGFDPVSTPLAGWRDHPFDLGNITHLATTFDLVARWTAYDPLHLFGWTPHLFYNPLATATGALLLGAEPSEAAYRWLLVGLLLLTALAFRPLLPQRLGALGRSLGALLAGWLSLVVYPQAVGILEADPVQVLYTGQWAQRLGVALGLLTLERLWRALQALGEDRTAVLRRSLAAAVLFAATIGCHYMSAVATAAAMTLLAIFQLVAGRLAADRWRPWALALPPAIAIGAFLLLADLLWPMVRTVGSHHSLALLGWRLPEAALGVGAEVLLAGLPVLLVPLLGCLAGGTRDRAALLEAGLPLLLLASVVPAGPRSLGLACLLLLAGGLLASRLRREVRAAHWLPSAAVFVLWLSAGPDSLQPFGIDLTVLVPAASGIGWAKLAALARFLLLAYLALLAAEGLAAAGRTPGRIRLLRALTACLLCAGLVLPVGLSLGSDGRTGAQTFFGWMAGTDREAQAAVETRLQQAALDTPLDGHLLLEDTLHHPAGSALAAPGVPNGHLPYLSGPRAERSAPGAEVTTRWITHPLAHTSRGALLCTPFERLEVEPTPVLDGLRRLGVNALLAHSPALLSALEHAPGVRRLESGDGLTRFALDGAQPLLTDATGASLPGAELRWLAGGLELRLPAGVERVRLRQVWVPTLECRARAADGRQPACTTRAWHEAAWHLRGCRTEDERELSVDVPWLEIVLADAGSAPTTVTVSSRAPLWPLILSLLAALAALTGAFALRSRAPDATPGRSRIWRLLEALVVLGVLGWVVRVLCDQLGELGRSTWQPAPGRLLLALAGGLVVTGVFGWLLLAVDFRALGHRLRFRSEWAAANLSRLGKYIPGKAHAVLGLVWIAHRTEGVPARVSSSIGILLAVQGVAVSLLSAAVLAPFVELPGGWRLGLLLLGAAALVMLHPRLTLGPIGRLLRWLGREPLTGGLSYPRSLALGAAAAALNLAKAGLFVVLADGLVTLPEGVGLHLALAYILAVLGGFLAFFAPAGIGVQEGAMLLLLAPALPAPQAALLTLASRVWNTVIDLVLGALGATALTGGRPPASPPPAPPPPPA